MAIGPRRAALTRREMMRLAGAGMVTIPGVALLGLRSPAVAQEASPIPAGALPPGCELFANGLISPRFLAFDDDGNLYVSEAGTGGDDPIIAPPAGAATPMAGGATPVPGSTLGNRGTTGQVSKIDSDGNVSVVVSGLSSYNYEGPVGPAGIAFGDDKIWLAIGGAGPLTPIVEPFETENSLLSIDPETGQFTKSVDIGAYERQNNPDPFAVDSNLYGLARKDDGTLYVADAGGNAVYSVDPDNGEITLLAVIPGIPYPETMEAPPGGNPGRGGANELDPVPTGVTLDGDTIYVGLLSGAPFPPEASKIVTIDSDGAVGDFATGLTMVTDVKKGPDDNFYACLISTNFMGAQPAPGSIVRISDDGTNEVVVPNLILPNGIAFDDDGNLFVTVMAITEPGSPTGMVVRCDGIASS